MIISVSDQPSLQYMWDLGDGAKTAWEPLAEATHTYRTPGRFKVTLWVKDDDGSLSNTTVNITIKNLDPVASVLSPSKGLSVREDQVIDFNGSGTDSPSDLPNLTFQWTIDGKVYKTQNISHAFTEAGLYDVSMKVTDPHGASSNASVQVTVTNVAPTLTAQVSPLTLVAGGFINFSVLGNDTASDRGNLTYEWTFGDGLFSNASSGAHTFGVAGTYNVKVVVTDDEGAYVTKSFSVTVSAVVKPKPVDHTDKGAGLWVLATVAGLTVAMVVSVVMFLVYGRRKGPKVAPEEKKSTGPKKIKKEKTDED